MLFVFCFEWKEQFVVCKLRKKHAHIFDTLSTRDQIADFKRYGTLDWEATTVGDDVDIYEVTYTRLPPKKDRNLCKFPKK